MLRHQGTWETFSATDRGAIRKGLTVTSHGGMLLPSSEETTMNEATKKALAEWNRIMEEAKKSHEQEMARRAWEMA
jgi:hypothetical protein